MKLVTRDTDYAVRALCFIAQKDEAVTSVSELVKELEIPRPFLRKILQILGKKGLLKSHKGLGGGFLLVLPPEKIRLADLIEIFQGGIELNECLFKKRLCPNKEVCRLKKKIDGIQRHVISELRNITLAALL